MNKPTKGFIICEAMSEPETPVIVKDAGNNHRTIIKATIQSTDVENRNHRMYPKSVIEKGLQTEYIRERLATKTLFGEAGHPLAPNLERQLYMDQSNMSHRINEIWWEGNLLKAYIESASTARGNDFEGIVQSGSKVAFSLRAVGPVVEKRGDITVVLDPLTIFTWDWILHPSHREAYMDNIVSESADLMNGNSIMKSEACNDIFVPFNEEGSIIEYIKNQSRNFKIMSEQFEMDQDNMTLSEDMRFVYAKQHNGDTIAVKTEDVIRKELNHYMKKIF